MNANILIIDDCEDDQRLFLRALKNFDCGLETATTAEAGFARIAASRPDLILLDYNLPDMDGLSFMKLLPEFAGAPIPIVMLTGEDSVEVAVEVMKHGANDYLVKDVGGRYLRLLPEVARHVLAAHAQHELTLRLQKEVEARLRLNHALMHNSMEGIHVADMQGNIVEANDAFCRMMGYTREEMAGCNVADWVTELSADQLREQFKDHLGKSVVVEAVHRRKDGSLINVEVGITGIEIEGQNFIFASSRDVTERKKAEAVLKQHKQMIDTSIDGFWVSDLEGNLLEANEAYSKMSGYSVDELMKMHISQLEAVRQSPEEFREHLAMVAKQGYDRYETRHRSKDGREIDLEVSVTHMAEPHRLIVFCHDITQSKASQLELLGSEANLRAMMDNSPYLSWMKDAEGRYIKINKVFASYLRLKDAEQAIGKTDLELQPVQQAEKYRADDAEVMASRTQRHIEESSFDGKQIHWVETYKTPIIDVHGNVMGTVGIARDITARKQVEQALKEAILELERKELSKNRFLAAAGHDLRQPLAAANLYLDTLKRIESTPDQHEIITRLGKAMDTFKVLLDALLNISKLDAGVVKPEYVSINVPSLMIWLEGNFAPMAREKHIDFKLYFSLKEELAVRSDLALVWTVLMNLVSNAIKFTPQGTILVSARRRGDAVLFQVWDNGIGIPDEYISLIFDEFYQIENQQRDRTSGLGLGLAITERALALLGGKIECRSKVGRGSVFGFSLPLDVSANLDAHTLTHVGLPEEVANDLFARGKRFVVVEDDVLVAQAMCTALRAMGGEVECFETAEAAMLNANTEQADYYIVDYMLGGKLNGIDLLNQLRQKLGRPINAVLVTGDTSTMFVRRASDCAWPVLHKPINISQLFASLGEPAV